MGQDGGFSLGREAKSRNHAYELARQVQAMSGTERSGSERVIDL
jgi:hypothetical protein